MNCTTPFILGRKFPAAQTPRGLQLDRTSCHQFELHILLTAAAYVLMQELRLGRRRYHLRPCASAMVAGPAVETARADRLLRPSDRHRSAPEWRCDGTQVGRPGVCPRRHRPDERRRGPRTARGPRPAGQPCLPRPLRRPAARPVHGDVHRHGDRPRSDPDAAARTAGAGAAGGVLRGGEAGDRDRAPAPRASAGVTASSRPTCRCPTRRCGA